MKQIAEIARMTFADAIRNRIAYGALLFLIIILLAVMALASVTMGRIELMILDLGLGSISIFGNLMAIVFTIQTLQQEKENRTLYVIVTRLDSRWKYLLGKFLGLSTILAIQVAIMCMLLSLCILPFGEIEWLSYTQACMATVLEIWIVIAIAMLFAQSSSLFLAMLFTLAADVTGRFTSTIKQFGDQADLMILNWITEAMFYALPNLEAVNLRNSAGYIDSYDFDTFTGVIIYGFFEIGLLLLLCILIFERRNLT